MRNADEVSVEFSGKYSLVVTNETFESMRNNHDIYVTWNKDKKKIKKDNVTYCLHREMVRVIMRKLEGMNMNDFSQGYLREGYTRVTMKTHDGTNSSSMHTQIFKERNGMTGPAFILKN